MISIIIPSYNHGRALLECLDSIRDQTYSDWEIIIVDDGSTDATEDLVKKYLASYQGSGSIRYVKQDNAGAPIARNAGASMAQGEYLLFADADIIFIPEALALYKKALDENSWAAFAYGDFRFGFKKFVTGEFSAEKLKQNNFIHTSALIRRSAFPGFTADLRRFQDWDLWLCMAEQGHTGVWISKVLFTARVTRKGMSLWRPRIWYALSRRFPSLASAAYWDYESARQRVLLRHSSPSTSTQPEVSIIIVSWNVADRLQACLKGIASSALFQAGKIECLVVDNDSRDNSASRVKKEFPQVRLLALRANAGFGRACNLGAQHARGKYLLFLNPDAECGEDAIQRLVTFLEEQPFVGIVAPQLRNSDGTIQLSTRRFPGVWVMCLLLLKIDRLYPYLKSLRRYFMSSFAHATLRSVDQVMGACFLMRKDLFKELNGFDERFYIWFEDVDLCLRMRQRGLLIFFLPEATAKHSLSSSFRKRNFFWKQWQLGRSSRQYTRKHGNVFSWLLVSGVSFVLLLPAALLVPFSGIKKGNAGDAVQRSVKLEQKRGGSLGWIAVFFSADMASLIAHYVPFVGTLAFSFSAAVEVLLAIFNFPLAVLAALGEVVVGSHGYLLSMQIGGFVLSLRIMLFSIVMVASVVRLLYSKKAHWIKVIKKSRPLIALALVVAMAFVEGLLHHRGGEAIYADGNAYVYIAFVIPLVMGFVAVTDFFQMGRRLFLLGAIYISLKTLLLHYFFTHAFESFTLELYQWLRDTRMAELTFTSTGVWRIFIPSQIYSLVVWCGVMAVAATSPKNKKVITLGVLAATLLISFSRSFWLGWVVAAVSLGLWLLWYKRLRFLPFIVLVAAQGMVAVVLLFSILVFPLPKPSSSGVLGLAQRLNLYTEAAASSRWNELGPLVQAIRRNVITGSGFGSTVTYVSNDPRVRSATPDGRYTTTAFEWGYLDMLLKFGAIGLGVLLWLLGAILLNIRRSTGAIGVRLGDALALLALVVVHIGSPYLNHPLGLAFLCWLFVVYGIAPALTNGETSATLGSTLEATSEVPNADYERQGLRVEL